MYNTNIAHTLYSNKLFVGAAKLYELIKLHLRPLTNREDKSKEYFPYIINAALKGYTILDIGSHRRSYFFDLFKISKLPGKVILFENTLSVLNYMSRMRQLMNVRNLVVEPVFTAQSESNAPGSIDYKGDNFAMVIDFKARISKDQNESVPTETIDSYCAAKFIVPALIKLKLDKNDLHYLHGAKQILKKYKPEILIECTEGTVSRQTLMAAFDFLADLNYSGYFILDTIKVPLRSFDFNIYQNEITGYYCKNFIFQ